MPLTKFDSTSLSAAASARLVNPRPVNTDSGEKPNASAATISPSAQTEWYDTCLTRFATVRSSMKR